MPQKELVMTVAIKEPVMAPAVTDVISTKKRFVLRIVLVVLTLALWKGWAEEESLPGY